MKRFDYYRAALCTPKVCVGNPHANADAIIDLCGSLRPDTQMAVFPELALSGYTCADLFYEDLLLSSCKSELERIAQSIPSNLACIVGLPLQVSNNLYNCAAFLFGGEVLGIYAKTHLPGYNEYYEPRWFSSSRQLPENAAVVFCGKPVPVSGSLLFSDTSTGAVTGIEICEDLWVGIPVSSREAMAGANILANCSASNEVISKSAYRKELVKSQSAKLYAAYLYCSAGPSESSTDLVFSGQNIAAENGHLLACTEVSHPEPVVYADIDLQHLRQDRIRFKTAFEESVSMPVIEYASTKPEAIELMREIQAYPFVPQDLSARLVRCQEILYLQARGLATRLSKIHCDSAVIGISGGLDSTLALLVAYRAFKLCGYDPAGIHCITMPGFGTTDRTRSNAWKLMDLLGVSSQEIPIGKSVRQHFEDIGQDESVHDITYENGQARERTQILMDMANKVNGIVVGTGDLSELALGWCTYNGDHMSMYAVNASVPKTLVRYLVESEALQAKEDGNEALCSVLLDICATPVSPELLPPDKDGKILQKTEEVLGSYDLHDFFLYHMLRHHERPEKMYELAKLAFPQVDEATIKKALSTFVHRFFTQQFKRSCLPDGPKVGSICLSPRGDWRMPSDADARLWKAEVETL